MWAEGLANVEPDALYVMREAAWVILKDRVDDASFVDGNNVPVVEDSTEGRPESTNDLEAEAAMRYGEQMARQGWPSWVELLRR
jgi:hypothetical protein